MVDYNNIITPSGVEKVEIVGEELTELQAKRTAWNNASVDRKLPVRMLVDIEDNPPFSMILADSLFRDYIRHNHKKRKKNRNFWIID